jgi:ABC-type multidrug transport system ATPase subunit
VLICDIKSFSGEEMESSINEVLEITLLTEFAHTFAKHLSGGMKRKLSLAIAIVSKP